jgi:HK97 family phage portal protein
VGESLVVKSPWAWFRDIFARRRGEDPQQQVMFQLPYPVAGIRLTAEQTLELSAVWACIRIVATSLGSCKWNIYQPTGPEKRQLLYDDPTAWLLNTRPNPDMTAIGWREAMVMVAMSSGNSYAEIVRDGGNRVAALYPLEADRVLAKRDPETWELFYEYTAPGGEQVRLASRDVFHLRGPGLHGLMGDNIIARAAKSLAVAAAQERHSAAYFGQGANPGGVLELPTGVVLTEKRKAELKEEWAAKKQGPENAYKPMMLEAGWKWNQASNDPQKSQLVEARQFSVEEICRWFGVPPHKVQHLLHATFSNIEHQSIEFVRDAVMPWERAICQEADFKLFPQTRGPWRYTCIDLEPLKEGDAKSRADAAGIWRQNGIKTANEIREREGMNDVGPEGDVLLVQSNLTTIANIMNPPAKVAPSPAPADPASTEDAAAAVARAAVTAFVVTALERYARRLQNRRNDLAKRKPPDQVEGALAEERARLLPRLVEELAPAAPFAALALGRGLERSDLQLAAELVDAGHAPAAAAARALPASCPRPG